MAGFAAKHLVSSATGGMAGRVGELGGDFGKQLSMENLHLTKKEIERAEKELERREKERKKKHTEKEASREKLRSNIRGKYGIKKRRGHEPVETHSGILMPRSEKELLLSVKNAGEDEVEDEDDCGCSSCCPWTSCLPCFPGSSKLR